MKKLLLLFFLTVYGALLFSQIVEDDFVYQDSLEYIDDDYYEDEVEDNSGYLGELSLIFGRPVGYMKDKFQKNFFGFNLGLYKQLNEATPLYIGGGVFFVSYDSESISYFDYGNEDGLEYEFLEEFKGNMFGIDVGAKYFSKKSFWVFNPYVQLSLEYRRAYASIDIVNVDLDETVNTEFEGGNSSFGYDIGMGSIVAVKSDKFFIDFRLSYGGGGGLFLYKRNKNTSATFVTDYFDKKYFPIGIGTVKIGITFL